MAGKGTDMKETYYSDERTPLRPRIRNRPSPGLKLSMRSKVFYGLGGIPYQLTNTVLGFYINVFLLETAKVPPFYTSAIVLIGRIWDAMTDPIIGFLVFRTKTRRFGKHKPWMLVATFPAIACFMCFFITPETTKPYLKLAWYLVFYCFFQTFLTFYQMPFATLTLCLTDNQAERDKATAFRMGSEVLGNLLGQFVMGLSLSLYQLRLNKKVPQCRSLNDTATIPPEEVEVKDQGYLVGAAVLCSLFFICSMCAIFGTKEVLSPKRKTKYEESFGQAVKSVLTFGPWVKHIAFLIPFVLAVNAMQGNFVLYSLHTLGMTNYQSTIIIILISAFLLMPLWRRCVKRLGKKLTLFIGLLPSVPLLVSWGIVPYGVTWVQYIMAILMGNVVAVVQLIPWSMVPDVIDDFLLKKKRGYETIFYTFYIMIVKLGSGICIGVTTIVLGVVEFKPGVCEVTDEVRFALRLMITCIPGGCILIGLLFLYLYPITEEIRKQNQTILEIWRDAGDDKRRQTMKHSSAQRFRSRSIRTPTMSFS
ncbi:sodium-dependent lysophosphatidylcholine symporter 1-B-like isoform X2 [Acanthaster planci]|uniref:Sodium-dependent lysophosphatidylcholine symporter 1-B-like isoform X2 n=1 Tax=Acanthaster planci TaxID=133434 RepID=A0A8B7Y8X6_ACAPL|nr:sodium-dependent lysophosphatidylcholine symporter 1-B-like isoform X2 [Acanthaster planci]